MTSPQEADPKLAKLRLAYESAVQHEHAEATPRSIAEGARWHQRVVAS